MFLAPHPPSPPICQVQHPITLPHANASNSHDPLNPQTEELAHASLPPAICEGGGNQPTN